MAQPHHDHQRRDDDDRDTHRRERAEKHVAPAGRHEVISHGEMEKVLEGRRPEQNAGGRRTGARDPERPACPPRRRCEPTRKTEQQERRRSFHDDDVGPQTLAPQRKTKTYPRANRPRQGRRLVRARLPEGLYEDRERFVPFLY
jgi:hypothetical protein